MQILNMALAGLLFFASQNTPKTMPPPDLSQFNISSSCPRTFNRQGLTIRLFDYYPAGKSNINGATRIIKGELKQGRSKITLWALLSRGWWWQTNYELFEEKNGKLISVTIDELSQRIHYDIREYHIAYIKNHRLC